MSAVRMLLLPRLPTAWVRGATDDEVEVAAAEVRTLAADTGGDVAVAAVVLLNKRRDRLVEVALRGQAVDREAARLRGAAAVVEALRAQYEDQPRRPAA